MYQNAGKIILRSGESVDMGIVRAPDATWANRILPLLAHKGEPFNWQNAAALGADIGIDVKFYLLHRAGQPFANIMTATRSGVGILGHVWTEPLDRGQGAASLLMQVVLSDFSLSGGQALFLETGYDSTAYHIYERFGFSAVEPLSASMEFYTTDKAAFEAHYFTGAAAIQPLDWRHWPGAQALFVGAFPGLVRCSALGLIGRSVSETPLLALLQADLARPVKHVRVLSCDQTGAVVGFALWSEEQLLSMGTYLIDLYCHPNYWSHADDLLAALTPPPAARWIAYADASDPSKLEALRRFGFAQTATLPQRVATSAAKTEFLDLLVFEKALL